MDKDKMRHTIEILGTAFSEGEVICRLKKLKDYKGRHTLVNKNLQNVLLELFWQKIL